MAVTVLYPPKTSIAVLLGKMAKSDEDILAWMLQKIDEEANCFLLLMKEVNEVLWARAKYGILEIDRTSPVLKNMMMTLEHLHMDAGTLLMQRRTEATGGKLNRELDHLCLSLTQLQSSKTEDKNKQLEKGQHVLNQSPDDVLALQLERFQSVPDPISVEEDNEQPPTDSQTQHDLLNDNVFCDLMGRPDVAEQKLPAKNKILEHDENPVKNHVTAKYIQQHLDSFEQLLGSGELPEKVSHLETEVYPDLLDRVEKLENHIRLVRRSVFGEVDGLAQGKPCVMYQLTDLQAMWHQGQAQLQVMGEKLQKLEDKFENRDSVAGASKEPEDFGEKSVAFQVCVDMNGAFKNGDKMDMTMSVAYNYGNVFDVEACQFVAPVSGYYNFGLLVKRFTNFFQADSKIEVWRCRNNEFVDRLFFVCLAGKGEQEGFNTVKEMQKGESAVVRRYGTGRFIHCLFNGSLNLPFGSPDEKVNH